MLLQVTDLTGVANQVADSVANAAETAAQVAVVAPADATDWGLVWTVTLLGFGVVLLVLVVLIFIMLGLGVVMQKINAPKAPKAEKKVVAPAPKKSAEPTDEGTMAAIAMALAAAKSDDEAAIAMALHLYYNNAHDIQTTYLTMTAKPTAWNAKSFGMNNPGF